MNRSREQESTSLRPDTPVSGRGRVAQIERLEPGAPQWDRLVATHPDYSFFHGASWAKVLQSSYGHAPCYLGAVDGKSLLALAPIMEVDSPLTGRCGVSLPFTDECPMLGSESVPGQAMVGEVLRLGRRRNWKYVEFRGVREGLIPSSPSLSFLGHTLDLSRSKSQIFSGFEGSVRRAIRKAERSGVGVEVSSSPGAVRDFYKLHCRTRRRHRLPPQPVSFFRRIQECVLKKGRGCVVLARDHERPVAGAVFFHLGERAVYKFGASDNRFQHLRGSNLVFWEAIRWLADRGIGSLQFGRSSVVQEGLRRFKLGFGTREHRIDYYRYDFGEAQFVSRKDPAFGWYNGFFGLLPLPLLRIIGGLSYRHLN